MTSKTTLRPKYTVRGPGAAPPKQGLYDPRFEHDACGVGFVVNIKGKKSHAIVQQALQVLRNLQHRGACGSEANTGDGAGVLMQVPHAFLEEACREMKIVLPGPGPRRVAESLCCSTGHFLAIIVAFCSLILDINFAVSQ